MFVKVVAVVFAALLASAQERAAPASPQEPFEPWLARLTAEARERGFDERVISQTLSGLEPLPRVVQSDRNQAELVMTLDRYVSARVTTAMVRRGREMARTHATLLARLESMYGVPRQYLIAIWGIESRFGRLIGQTPVFQALATLAWEPRRADFFRAQLFDAMRMVERGDIDVPRMTGSWAGAMGQTQFMPSSYLQYAVDFDSDGRRDIWTSTPDALASIANYLKGYGWEPGLTWGREVRLSETLRTTIESMPQRGAGCYAIRTMTGRQSLDEWRRLGVTRLNGTALPRGEVEAGMALVGERAFLAYQNYDAILGYNCAHFYALSVSLLADRIRQ
jgi:membrane-bound lytic murein transglycosylase B